MTPEEKGKELIEKFKKYSDGRIGRSISYTVRKEKSAKACAIICVDEILNLPNMENNHGRYIGDENYWQQVKDYLTKQPDNE